MNLMSRLARETRPRAERIAVFIGTGLAVALLASANGGYFPSSWSWACLAFSLISGALIVGTASRFSRTAGVFLGLFALLVAWSLASAGWFSSGAPVFAAERTFVYLSGAAAALLAVRRRTIPALLGGALGGLVVIDLYALGTRLLPDRLGRGTVVADRLAAPIGYWNGLGLATGIAALLALGFALRGSSPVSRCVAASVLPVLLPTLYFTFSRGSWIVLAIGLVVLVAFDERRLQLIAIGLPLSVPAAVVVWLAWRSSALNTAGVPPLAAASAGHHLAGRILVAAAASACLAAIAYVLERAFRPSVAVRRVFASVAIVAAVAGLAVGVALAGGPGKGAHRAWHSFTGSGVHVRTGQSEGARLLSLSNNGRTELWHAAWREGRSHPVIGGGAGSYESWWLAHRHSTQKVRDAHSLYLQTFAELGAVGLGLLVLALSLPLVAAIRARRRPLVSFVAAAYVIYLIHTAGDWDWQLPGVTLPAILAAVALLISAGGESRPLRSGGVRSAWLIVPLAALALSCVMVLGNVPLTRASSAANAAQWARSEREARKAERWLPWSAEPWRLIGEADLARRRGAAARQALRKGLAREPGNWQLWFDLSAAETGRAAQEALNQARKLNPLSPEIEQLGKG
jgi:general stress protein CsbA